MEDRFRFRVWCNEYDEPFYYNEFGFDVHLEPDGAIVAKVLCVDDEGREFWSDLSGLILEQCTGVKDRNGKLIYEGDIIKTKLELDNDYKQIIGPIILYRLGYQVKTKKLGYIPLDVCGLFANVLKMPSKCDLTEVIGNIHENPELLKEQDNGKK